MQHPEGMPEPGGFEAEDSGIPPGCALATGETRGYRFARPPATALRTLRVRKMCRPLITAVNPKGSKVAQVRFSILRAMAFDIRNVIPMLGSFLRLFAVFSG